MKLHGTNDTVLQPENGQTDFVTFDLVSELLALPLTGTHDEIVVEAKSQDFLFVPGGGITATAALRAEIDSEEVLETDGKVEVNVTGTINNQKGQKDTFSLFFYMHPNGAAPSFLRTGVRNVLESNALHLNPEGQQSNDMLHDAFFSLTLYCKQPSGQMAPLGKGKGFLLFGQGRSMGSLSGDAITKRWQ